MKAFIFTILLSTIFFSSALSNKIEGIVLLDNTDDHSSTLVEFIPISNSAVYNSIVSDINGFFSTDLISGSYRIRYSKAAYQTHEIDEVFINTDLVLDQIELSSKGLKEISGVTTGIWYKDTTYVVTGNITIPSGNSLVIEPGTHIHFDDYWGISVDGSILAKGTKRDSILFTSGNTVKERGDWEGLRFNSSSDTSFFSYTKLEYAGPPRYQDGGIVWIVGGKVVMDHCKLAHSPSVGIFSQRGYLEISESEIFEVFQYGIRNWTNSIIEKNIIHHIEIAGINNYSLSPIRFNVFYNNRSGLELHYSSVTENNIFLNNFRSGVFIADEEPIIINNTFITNSNGIMVYYGREGKPLVTNNIFHQNDRAINNDNDLIPTVSYNLFFDNDDYFKVPPVGFGEIVTKNGREIESDTYFNLFEDPFFVSTTFGELGFANLDSLSPAINTGDPTIFDEDGSIGDLGAIWYGENAPPSDFLLISPSLSSTLSFASSAFEWQDSKDLDPLAYSLFIYNDHESVNFSNLKSTSIDIDVHEVLSQGEDYEWYVLVTDGIDTTYSDTLSFSTENIPPSDFLLISPTPSSTLPFTPFTFEWENSSDLDPLAYSLFIYNDDDTVNFSNLKSTLIDIDVETILSQGENYKWYVFASDGMDTTYSDTLSFSIEKTLSVQSESNNLFFYPNPTSHEIQIFDNSKEYYRCYIYTLDGRLVLSDLKKRLDVSSLKKGVYMVLIHNKLGAVV
ncbi:MAG: right-handed parallel beta-helix repeat-containing protein, partial [Bacteroidota bacterium]